MSANFECGKWENKGRISYWAIHLMKLCLLEQYAPDLKGDYEFMLKNIYSEHSNAIWRRTLHELKKRGLAGVKQFVQCYDCGDKWTRKQARQVARAMEGLEIGDHGHFTPMLEEIRQCFIYAKKNRAKVESY